MADKAKFLELLRELQSVALTGDRERYNAALTALAAAGRAEAIAIPLASAALSSTATTANVAYSAPGTQALLIDEVRGIIRFTNFDAETTAFSSGVYGGQTAPPTFMDRMAARAYACRIDKLASNRQGDIPFVDITKGYVTVGDLHPQFGEPMRFRAPKILYESELTLSLALADTDSSVIGGTPTNTAYGVALVGTVVLS